MLNIPVARLSYISVINSYDKLLNVEYLGQKIPQFFLDFEINRYTHKWKFLRIELIS